MMFVTNRALTEFPWAYKHGVFTPAECKQIILMGEKLKKADGVVAQKDNNGYGVNTEVRRSQVGAFLPNPETAWIFDRVSKNIILLNAEFYRYDVYGFDYIQFGKYDAKDRGLYVWHMDSMFNDSNPHPGLFRKLSVTLLLNDDFDGGKFQFMLGSPEAISEPEMSVGTMILFPSYISHQVTEVTKGCRMSLVVWVVGPRFK